MNRTKLGKEEGKNIPGTRSRKYKSPEREENVAHLRTGREANKAAERRWSRIMEMCEGGNSCKVYGSW